MKIVVTGGSRGIGYAIANSVSKDNELVLISRDEQKQANEIEKLMAAGAKSVRGIICDFAEPEQAVSRVSLEIQSDCKVDGLILCAGSYTEGSLTEISVNELRETIEINLFSHILLARYFLQENILSKGSKIIIIGSTAAYEPYSLVPTYGVAKWAIRGFAINLRKELADKGISVTLLSPGATLTDMWAGEYIEPGRLLEPSDIGELVKAIFALSPQAVVEEIIVRSMLGDIHE